MALTKTVNVETTNARASTTLTDTTPTVPLPDTPQGLMVIGPQVTLHFVEGDWNQANSYDYYDVVQVDGTSYIAVQDVPANTAITNTAYWAKWNDPNAQVEQVQETVSTFDARITAAQSTATAAQGAATQAQSTATSAQGAATAAQSTADAALNVATKNDIVCMGDSLAAGIINDGSSPNSQFGWLNFITTHKPVGVDTVYVNTATVIEGNTGFTSTRTFLAVIKDMVENSVITDKNTVKHIYISGGTNDYAAGQQAIVSAITTFCDYVKANLPNADITIMYQGTNHWEAFNGYRQGAYENGCRFESTGFIMCVPGYTTDGTHLTEQGYQATLPYVYDLLFGDGAVTGNLATSIKFDTADLHTGVTVDGISAGVQYSITPRVATCLVRNTDNPYKVIFNTTLADTTPPNPLVDNFNKYMINGYIDMFIPALVTAEGVGDQTMFLYYDASSNALVLPPLGNTNFNNKALSINVMPVTQTYLR